MEQKNAFPFLATLRLKLMSLPEKNKLLILSLVVGVCSGLALYLDVDVTLIRVFMLAALICGSAGFWIYVILWIAVPVAETPAQKCELRGLPATAEQAALFPRGRRIFRNRNGSFPRIPLVGAFLFDNLSGGALLRRRLGCRGLSLRFFRLGLHIFL